MVEESKRILNILKENNKPVWVFAVLKMDEFIDKWSFIISAPWINDSNENTQYEAVLNIIKQNIADEKLSSIARIVFLDKEDHLIEELLKRKSGDQIKDEKMNGNIIHEGLVVESNPNLTWEENKQDSLL